MVGESLARPDDDFRNAEVIWLCYCKENGARDIVCGLSQPAGATSRNENVTSLGSEGPGYRPAGAGRRAGNDGNLIAEQAHMNDHLSDLMTVYVNSVIWSIVMTDGAIGAHA